MNNQHSTARKFSQRWFGPYVVKKVEDNATYRLAELDGTPLALPIAEKRVKIFKKWDEEFLEINVLENKLKADENSKCCRR